MTAMIIPNAIQISTLHARHTFASFLARDTTYDLIVSIWRISHPSVPPEAALPDHEHPNSALMVDSDDSHDEAGHTEGDVQASGRKRRAWRKRSKSDKAATAPNINITSASVQSRNELNESKSKRTTHRLTSIPPSVEVYKDVMMDQVFNSSPEKIYNLMFTSEAFMRDFWTSNQKLSGAKGLWFSNYDQLIPFDQIDIQLGDWKPPASAPAHLLTREFSYIKPINAPVGPKQLRCLVCDVSEIVDFDNYVVVLSITRTPDAPSGGSFSTKTKTCITWAKNNTCRVQVFTMVEWTKSSFLKGKSDI